jgi:manganese-dependent inorganic pyrophosphatase
MIKVFGHLSPDTDSVLSAITFAWYLNNVEKKEAVAYRCGEMNKETKYVLDRFQLPYPELLTLNAGDEVAIVDTNNPEELPTNLSEAKILYVVDHHKMAGLSTPSPLSVTIRPVASTTSLLYSSFFNGNTSGVDKHILGIILAGILSDTLEFRSPTTTEIDKQNAVALATELGISTTELATEMFNAKSDVSEYTAKQLITIDSKVFQIKGKALRVSVLETTNPAAVLTQKDAVKVAMDQLKQEEKFDDMLFFVVDILKEEAHLVATTPSAKDIAEAAFGVTIESDVVILPGVLSRKKQIIPMLEK